MPDGRFAPSPTGPLHLGNLRTAMCAWLFARSSGSRFSMRMEDLDGAVARAEYEQGQLEDLAAIGIDWDPPVVRQSARRALYDDAIATLTAQDLTYPCYCTRREILEAAVAPNGPPAPEGAYPGTCRRLSTGERARLESQGRPPALRLRAPVSSARFVDRLCGPIEGAVDDFVLRRNDGTAAYNLAVVVDDATQAIAEVVRADDLLASTPRQVVLAGLLSADIPGYAHVPLVLGPDGVRLAKRHGSVTLTDQQALGRGPAEVRSLLAASLGLVPAGTPCRMGELRDAFVADSLPREPWVLGPEVLAPR